MDYEMIVVRTMGYKNGAIAALKLMGFRWGDGDRYHLALQLVKINESDLPDSVKALPKNERAQLLKTSFRYLGGHFIMRPAEEIAKRNPRVSQ